MKWYKITNEDEMKKIINEKGTIKHIEYIDGVLHAGYKEFDKDKPELVAEAINKILDITDSYKAPDKIMEILYGDVKERDRIFNEFLELFDKDITYDWFHYYFQAEHAERKSKKQDFTPQSVSKVLNTIAGVNESWNYYEPAAGTGGIMIEAWNQNRYKHSPLDFRPSEYYYTVEELSDRTFPFLLFNMCIRGLDGNAIHCDSITREAKGAFFIQNDKDDHMLFSSLNLLPYNEWTEKELNIKFTEEKYKTIRQTEEIPDWLGIEIDKFTVNR